MTKTAIIFCTTEELVYFVVDGDYEHLDGVYIGSDEEDIQSHQNRLEDLIYNDKGQYAHQPVDVSELKSAVVEGSHLIETGCIL